MGHRDARPQVPLLQFVTSEDGSIALVSLIALVCLGVPLTLMCHRHFAMGHHWLGCAWGTLGTLVLAVSGWTLSVSLWRARRRFSET
ncbi:MAG: hypothetical protein ABEJ28_08525 [Salinigranum sp.]